MFSFSTNKKSMPLFCLVCLKTTVFEVNEKFGGELECTKCKSVSLNFQKGKELKEKMCD